MEFKIKNDGEGYLAEVEGNDSIFAYGKTEEEAKTEFIGVLDMMIDYHSELVTNEKALRNIVLNNKEFNYAL